jgi:3-dehydroquinate synthase
MRMRQLLVELGARSYSIQIGSGLLDQIGLLADAVRGKHALIVSDANVAPLYLARVEAVLAGKDVWRVVIPAGEAEKNLARFSEILHALAAQHASRDVTVIALGGGVIGDLAGFAAACWMRGVRFVQLPTTLLAMVDSAVGGKTAVDLPAGKNLVGAFHQPAAVFADTDTLNTLPERELRAGLAEVVKYGAIFDPRFFDWIETHADALLARDADALAEAVLRSCKHKIKVVVKDETERGPRALLNFGHTFGHAIETEAGYGTLLHGEAVAIGMVLAARLSAELGRAPLLDAARLAGLLAHLGLPIELPEDLAADALLARMRLDKKAVSGQLRLVLWKRLGRAVLADDVPEAALLEVLRG